MGLLAVSNFEVWVWSEQYLGINGRYASSFLFFMSNLSRKEAKQRVELALQPRKGAWGLLFGLGVWDRRFVGQVKLVGFGFLIYDSFPGVHGKGN